MVRLYGDRLAVMAGNDRLTYTELNRAANRVARAILAQRGSVNEPIALLVETGMAAIIAILGVLKAGKAYVPLETSYPPARLGFMLTDSEASMVISGKIHAADVAGNGPTPAAGVGHNEEIERNLTTQIPISPPARRMMSLTSCTPPARPASLKG